MALPYLRFDAVSKSYPGVNALQSVSFGVHAGSVHALMGENGAGKSTLLKVLSGAHRPTSGKVLLDEKSFEFASTSEAMHAGVAVIYQELHLVPSISVAENIFLGHLPTRHGLIDQKKLRESTTELLQRLGEQIDPFAKISALSIGQRQMVEIAKALSRGAKVIAFDEPTSSLSAREIEKLFSVIRDLRAQGCVILYVTHRMEEVFNLCDACTVLRDGRHVRTHESLKTIEPPALVRDMVGRDIADVYGYQPRRLGPVAFSVRNVVGKGLRQPISFSVAQGEVLGVFGLIGAGRTELLKIIFGAEPARGGSIEVHSSAVVLSSPADAISAGIFYCTEDRKRDGIIPILSVAENCNLSARGSHLRLSTLIDETWEHSNAIGQVEALRVKTPSLRQPIKNLSGGNQQKVILGRGLSTKPRVLLLDEPTRGIDIGAKSEIYQIIFNLAREGAAIVLVSSDLPEVLGLADRVAVMREGEISAVFLRENATAESVLAQALPLEKSFLAAS